MYFCHNTSFLLQKYQHPITIDHLRPACEFDILAIPTLNLRLDCGNDTLTLLILFPQSDTVFQNYKKKTLRTFSLPQ